MISYNDCGGPKKDLLFPMKQGNNLLGAGVLGDSLGALRDGVLGELTREEKPDSSLDLTGGDGGPLVVVSKSAGLSGDSLEQIVDERVHDAHGLGGDSSVRVDLLQHLVDRIPSFSTKLIYFSINIIPCLITQTIVLSLIHGLIEKQIKTCHICR